MDIMLTAFGLSHLGKREENPFYHLPPHTLSVVNRHVMPDFSMLLLCNKLIIDEESFDRLMHIEHVDEWAYSDIYAKTSDIIKLLHEEGFVRLENFSGVIEANRPLLEKMTNTEIQALDQWVLPLKESVLSWRQSFETLINSDPDGGSAEAETTDAEIQDRYHYLISCYMHGQCYAFRRELIDEALNSSRARRRAVSREVLTHVLGDYLAYVNANLVLAQHFDCAFHDWADMRPFYDLKFLRIGQANPPGQSQMDKLKSLFTVSFPEFTLWTPQAIVKALQDKRISELRGLVKNAVENETEFDHEFANQVFREVLQVERGIGKLRNIVSYATIPLDFVPVVGTPLQKIAEEIIVYPLAQRKMRKFRWFYLISEVSGNHQNGVRNN